VAIDLRDYYYLDTLKLQHYAASLDSGDIEAIRTVTRTETQEQARAQSDLGVAPEDRHGIEENVSERTLRISELHTFSRLHQSLLGQMIVIDEDTEIDFDAIGRSSIVELTRDFVRSPINEMIDSLLQLTD
jgi:hypothetical protein